MRNARPADVRKTSALIGEQIRAVNIRIDVDSSEVRRATSCTSNVLRRRVLDTLTIDTTLSGETIEPESALRSRK